MKTEKTIQNDFTLTSGKRLTAPAAFRLPFSDYIRAQKIAEQKGVSMARLFQEAVTSYLQAQENDNGIVEL